MKKQKYSHKRGTSNLNSRMMLSTGFVFIFVLVSGLFGYSYYHGQTNKDAINIEIVAEAVPKPARYDLSIIAPPSEGQFAIANLEDGINQDQTKEQIAPMASITKVITAMAILDKSPILPGESGITITLNAQDEQYYNDYIAIEGTVTGVTAGQTMTQYEALQTILLASSNNMSDSLVDRYFSSRQEYLSYANKMINDMGLINTQVADTTGFSPQSVSTPTELLKLAKKALEDPIIAEIVAQKEAVVAVALEIPNYNLLIDFPFVTGLKPGLTDEAGYCLLFSADIPNKAGEIVTVVGVVLGIRDRDVYESSLLQIMTQTIEIISST